MSRLHGQRREDCYIALREDRLADGSTIDVKGSSVFNTMVSLKTSPGWRHALGNCPDNYGLALAPMRLQVTQSRILPCIAR